MLAKPICLYVWKYEERCTVPKLLPSSLVAVGCSLPYTSYTGRKCRYHTEDGFETYTHFDRFLCGFDQLLSSDLWHGTIGVAYTEQQGDHLGSSDSFLV